MVEELSFRKKLARSRLIQNFRHRIYIPLILSFDIFNDFRRGVSTQALIDPSDLGFSSLEGNHYEATRYSTLKKILHHELNKLKQLLNSLDDRILTETELTEIFQNHTLNVNISNNCSGSVLKTFYKNRVPTGKKLTGSSYKGYGGFFWTDKEDLNFRHLSMLVPRGH